MFDTIGRVAQSSFVWLSDLKNAITAAQILFAMVAGALAFFGGSILAIPRIFEEKDMKIMFFGSETDWITPKFDEISALLRRMQIMIIIPLIVITPFVMLLSVAYWGRGTLVDAVQFGGTSVFNFFIAMTIYYIALICGRSGRMDNSMEKKITHLLFNFDHSDAKNNTIKQKLNASGTTLSLIATLLTICAVYLNAIKPDEKAVDMCASCQELRQK